MYTLFIDTHSEKLLISLLKDEKILEEISKEEKNHSVYLMPSINDILNNNHIEVDNIDQIIVVNGPGSFTGVRLGVTVAKTLAYTLNAKIYPISSLEVYGESANEEFDLICIKDSKGVYSARKEKSEYRDFEYRKNDDFNNYIESNRFKPIFSERIDLIKVLNYIKNKESVNLHSVNPLYVKLIDVEKW